MDLLWSPCSALIRRADLLSDVLAAFFCRIYVHSMKAPRLAEAYCDRLYERRAHTLAASPTGAAGARLLQPAWSRSDLQPAHDIYLALVEVCAATLSTSGDAHVL